MKCDIANNRKQFLEERRQGIGGSDVASLVAAELPELGLKPFKTPLEVYYSKILEPEEQEATPQQKRGTNAESLVANIYLGKTRKSFMPEESSPKFLKHEYMVAHPDAWVYEARGSGTNVAGVLECKTVHHSKAELWKTTAPTEYWLQCVHYAIVCEVPFVDIAGMIGFEGLSGEDEFFKIYTYHRDKKLEQRIINIEERFWENHVLKRNPPKPMTMSDTYLLHPFSNRKKTITATKEIQEIITKEKELYEQEKSIKQQREKLNVQAALYTADSYRLIDESGNSLATYGESERKSTNYKKLKDLVGDEIYNQVVSVSTSKSFKPTRKKI